MGETTNIRIGGYHLTEVIGVGGMGTVLKGVVEADGKPLPNGSVVAVKLLHPHLRTVQEFVKRFHREAKLAAAIDHPNVVRVLENGIHDKRHHYIVMEHAEGMKLTDLIGGQPLSPQQTIEVMNQVCAALGAAAAVSDPEDPSRVRSLVHRDVKPDNIIIQALDRAQLDTMTRTGDRTALANIRVKLLDFGLAKDVKALSTVLSQTGQSLGTPAYMSPEQCRGDEVDQRSDIYSLGVVAYHMITGTQPFAGPTTVAYATQHAEEIPPDILKRNPLCPRNLADCIYRCLAKAPADRYGTPADLQADLARVADGRSVVKTHRFRKKGSFAGRKVAAIAAVSVLCALLAVGAVWHFATDRAKGDLAAAVQRADIQIAAEDYAAARDSLQAAIAAFPDRPDKPALTADAQGKLRDIAARAAQQQAARAKADDDRRMAAEKADAERKRQEKEAADAAARRKHEQDAIAAIAAIKARIAAGDYQPAIDAANAAIRDFSDTPSGKEIPDLLAAATERLKGQQAADDAKAAAERQRLAAEAKAKHERFLKYRDEGDAAFNAVPANFALARAAYEKSLAEETDPAVKARLDACVERTTRQGVAVIDFDEKGDVGFKDAGQTVAELVLTRLGQDRFQLIERSQLAALLKEMDLTIALVRENPEKVYGRLKGVRYLILGRVSRLGNVIVTARMVNVATGQVLQTAEVSAEDARTLQNALTELVRILQMTDAEKKLYLDEKQYPALVSDARAKAAAKEYDSAASLYRRALAIRPSPEIEAELKAVLADQESWSAFQKLFTEAKRIADGLPADADKLTAAQRVEAQSALRAIQAALLHRPNDRAAIALRDRIADCITPAKAVALDLGGGVKLHLARIPAGKFTMGSTKQEQETFTKAAKDKGIEGVSFADEGPQREVTISRPFYMGVYEVTREQFAAFVSATGYKTEAEKDGWAYGWDGKAFGKVDGASWKKPGFDQTDDHPVVCVSWNDAEAFCLWLGKKSGRAVHLPTEAQWEYACRAGTTTAYQWGDDPDEGRGWCNGPDQTAKKEIPFKYIFDWSDGYTYTAPGGRFKANAFGLYDMHGNVWEWCADWYVGSYADAKNQDPEGPASGSSRVARGGCWSDGPAICRSALRGWGSPATRYSNLGFRVSLDLE